MDKLREKQGRETFAMRRRDDIAAAMVAPQDIAPEGGSPIGALSGLRKHAPRIPEPGPVQPKHAPDTLRIYPGLPC